MRNILLSEIILVLVRIQDSQDKTFAKNPIKDLRIIEEILQVNYINPDLDKEYIKARNNTPPWKLTNRLLLYNKKLVIPDGYNNLRTRLL